MHVSRIAAAAALALLPACAAPQREAPPLPPIPCVISSHGTLVMAEADLGMAPGESRQLAPPLVHAGPAGRRPIMEGCPVEWSVMGAGAQIDSAGRLTLARDARPGDSLHVVARAMSASARARVQVVPPGPNPLAGTWGQVQTPTCVGYQGLVGELVLRRSGTMLLTVRPFESYVDIAGSYTFDPATALLQLKSSTRPADGGLFLAGRARVEGDSLRITPEPDGDRIGLFAAMPGDRGCTAVFRRLGGAP
jgi:hypothetical protein